MVYKIDYEEIMTTRTASGYLGGNCKYRQIRRNIGRKFLQNYVTLSY